jgi:hypothetical protein
MIAVVDLPLPLTMNEDGSNFTFAGWFYFNACRPGYFLDGEGSVQWLSVITRVF